MLRISLPTYLRTDTKALPTYLLNISIPEEFLSIYNPAPLGTMRPTEDDVTSVIKDFIDEIVDMLVGVTESDDGD